MRKHWIAGIVLGSICGPSPDAVVDGKGTSTSGKILAKWPEGAARVLEDASIGPLLRFVG